MNKPRFVFISHKTAPVIYKIVENLGSSLKEKNIKAAWCSLFQPANELLDPFVEHVAGHEQDDAMRLGYVVTLDMPPTNEKNYKRYATQIICLVENVTVSFCDTYLAQRFVKRVEKGEFKDLDCVIVIDMRALVEAKYLASTIPGALFYHVECTTPRSIASDSLETSSLESSCHEGSDKPPYRGSFNDHTEFINAVVADLTRTTPQ